MGPGKVMSVFSSMSQWAPDVPLAKYQIMAPSSLPALFRFPREICQVLVSSGFWESQGSALVEICEAGCLGADKGAVTRAEFNTSCAPFLLSHAPVVAAALGA